MGLSFPSYQSRITLLSIPRVTPFSNLYKYILDLDFKGVYVTYFCLGELLLYWSVDHCLQSGSVHLFFPHLKSEHFWSRCYYQILHSMLFIQEIIKIVFRWCLNRYYSMILSWCFYETSFLWIKMFSVQNSDVVSSFVYRLFCFGCPLIIGPN